MLVNECPNDMNVCLVFCNNNSIHPESRQIPIYVYKSSTDSYTKYMYV